MSSTRTIFIENGLPILEDHASSNGHAWWVTVKFLEEEVKLSDVKLMDIVIERLQNKLFEVTQGDAMHHQQKLYVSFPADITVPMHEWFKLALEYAEQYKEDIIAGNVSIDFEYVFGLGSPGSR
ncbi:uncharacterized protein N7500_001099 [Penicillium coprophilum]|uniref:uncharacterized protein n=1 Tax=Penicillium coprophilum TaxID=36646 RepID=UPI002396F5FB|nr:uncharacterized protein N7500_001099 [Penicillium coprophilum]KAJ5178400.1 hypothetical protein N7500_001099 [Penicillium coprophilum]